MVAESVVEVCCRVLSVAHNEMGVRCLRAGVWQCHSTSRYYRSRSFVSGLRGGGAWAFVHTSVRVLRLACGHVSSLAWFDRRSAQRGWKPRLVSRRAKAPPVATGGGHQCRRCRETRLFLLLLARRASNGRSCLKCRR